ncbi:MAG TPA: HAMP domain-containing protein [Ktedonobacteraceae bacterium]|nr:HAMP domain-containing protein [Ktedonobacteraceae bacterium]
MWRLLTNMSIARRLMLAATLTAFIPGIVIAVLGSSYIGTLSTINETVQAGNNAVKLVTDMQADLLRMNALLGALNTATSSVSDNVQNGREIAQLVSDFNSALDIYQRDYQIATSARMKSVHDTLQGDSLGTQAPISQHSMIYVVDLQWKLYRSAQNQVLQDVQRSVGVEVLSGDIAQANLEYLPLKGNLDNLVSLTESISQIVAQVNTFKINPIFFWTILAFLFSTLMVFAISYLINLTITRPLRQLVHLTERIAQGETSARAVVKGHDETYMVAASMNAMLDSIVKLMQNIQRQHDLLEARVQKLIAEIKVIGSGDLRARAEVTPDALGFLAHSFNYMIDELSGLVMQVKTTTDEIEAVTCSTRTSLGQVEQIDDPQLQATLQGLETVEKVTILAGSAVQKFQDLSMSDEIERSRLTMENINTNLTQQLLLSQAALRVLQYVEEASTKSHDSTREAMRSVEKLSQLVALLRTSVGAFKLREEVR